MAFSAQPFTVHFSFHGDLGFFLRNKNRSEPLVRVLREKTSVKDAIESCGVPHPEVDLIVTDDVAVPFEHCLVADAVVEVYGVLDSPPGVGEALQRRRVINLPWTGISGSSLAIFACSVLTWPIRPTLPIQPWRQVVPTIEPYSREIVGS